MIPAMEDIIQSLFIGLFVFFLVVVVLAMLRHLGRRLRGEIMSPSDSWQEAANALGLRLDPARDGRLIMAGDVRNFSVHVSIQGGPELDDGDGGSTGSERRWTRYELSLPGWVPISAELTAGARLFEGQTRVLTGDPEFDRRIKAFGPERQLLPLLDYDARKAILAGADLGIEVTRREVRRRNPNAESRAPRLIATVQGMAAIAAGLDPEERTAAEQLAKTVRRDPVAGARERALQALAEWFPDDLAAAGLASDLAGSGLPARRVLALPLLPLESAVAVAKELITTATAEDNVRQQARGFLIDQGVELDTSKSGALSVADTPAEEGRLSTAAKAEAGALSKKRS